MRTSVLIAVADISKLLWPKPGRNKGKPLIPERGDELRGSLSVTEPSPLQPPSSFRNHFEHFDERLECWATSVEGANFVDQNIGPVEHMTAFGLPAQTSLRNYNPQDGTLTYRGEVHELWPVITAVGELWQKATVEASKPVSPSGQKE